MDKTAKPLPMNDMRGTNQELSTGMSPQGFTNPGPTRNLRGVESNTARGVKEKVQIMDVTDIMYGPKSCKGPEYRTYEEGM